MDNDKGCLRFGPELNSTRLTVSLDGTWGFAVDPDNLGEKQGWQDGTKVLDGAVQVPGAWQAQGYSGGGWSLEAMTANESSATAQSGCDKRFYRFAWYRREFVLPDEWQGKRVWLRLGGVSSGVKAWVNGKYHGASENSLVSIKCDITDSVVFGSANVVMLKINNKETYVQTVANCPVAGNWGGPYRSISLEATSDAWIEELEVLPDSATGKVEVRVSPGGNIIPDRFTVVARIRDRVAGTQPTVSKIPVTVEQHRGCDIKLTVDNPHLWFPQDPFLYDLTIVLSDAGRVVDEASLPFGFCEFRVQGRDVLVNGVPIHLRAFNAWTLYVGTLAPPDKDTFKRWLMIGKAYGFNLAHGCQGAIPKQLMEAADEVGMLVSCMMPVGGLMPQRAWRLDPHEEMVEKLSREIGTIVRHTRHHPSMFFYGMSSELYPGRRAFQFFSRMMPAQTRLLAPRSLVIDTTSRGTPSTDKRFGARDTDLLVEHGAGANDFAADSERPRSAAYSDKPLILHEYYWWVSYPNPKLRRKYIDAGDNPYWLDHCERIAREHGHADELPRYVEVSERLQALCFKYGLEYTRRDPIIRGFMLWMFTDTGRACEGVVTDFWEKKFYSAEEFSRFNGDTVLLIDDRGIRNYRFDDKFDLPILVSHVGRQNIDQAEIRWTLLRDSFPVERGVIGIDRLEPRGTAQSMGAVTLALPQPKKQAPGKSGAAFEFLLELADGNGAIVSTNQWTFYGYPRDRTFNPALCAAKSGRVRQVFPELAAPGAPGVKAMVVSELDEDTLGFLERGGRVILLSLGELPERRKRYCELFRGVPWHNGSDGNEGTIIYDHPIMKKFPHAGWCALQFGDLIFGSHPLLLDPVASPPPKPVIRCIDHYLGGRHKAYLYEIQVGQGRLIVTSLLVEEMLATHPEAQFLLAQIIEYACADSLASAAEVDIVHLRSLIRDRSEENVVVII